QAILKIPSGGYVIGPINSWAVEHNGKTWIPTPPGQLEVSTKGAVLEVRLNNDKQAKFDLKAFLGEAKRTLTAQNASKFASSPGLTLREDAARLLSGDGDPGIKLAIAAASGDLESDKHYSWTVYVLLPAEP